MYEVSISVDAKDRRYLDYIDAQLSRVLCEAGGVCARHEDGDRSYLALACEQTQKKCVTDALRDSIFHVISLGYKNDYFRDKMLISGESLLARTLLNTMCIFDTSADKRVAREQLGDLCDISLDGIYHFRLYALRKKWDEIIELTNANKFFLSNDVIMRDFLFFLVDAVPSQYPELTVKMSGDGYSILLPDGTQMSRLRCLARSFCPEEELLLNLICLKPQKVHLIAPPDIPGYDFTFIARFLFDYHKETAVYD